jgi:hypothetical protein
MLKFQDFGNNQNHTGGILNSQSPSYHLISLLFVFFTTKITWTSKKRNLNPEIGLFHNPISQPSKKPKKPSQLRSIYQNAFPRFNEIWISDYRFFGSLAGSIERLD